MTNIQESTPVWWTTDPAAAHAAAKVGVVYGDSWGRLSVLLEEQVKPAIDEPTEFGSMVEARWVEAPDNSEPMEWIYTPWHGEHYWRSGGGLSALWSELRVIRVLRVGIGDADEAYVRGVQDTVNKVHSQLRQAVEELAQ